MAESGSKAVHGSHRRAEWALWSSGLLGTAGAILFGTLVSALAHGATPDGVGEPAGAELWLATLAIPPAVHVATIAAAVGLARGRRWSVQLARVVAILLVAGLPVSIVADFNEDYGVVGLVRRQVFGVVFNPLPAMQATLGALALFDLRKGRPIVSTPIAEGPPPRHVARAGGILAALGLWQAGLIVAGALRPESTDGLTRHPLAFLIAAIAAGAVGVLVGRGVRAERRWAVPATPGAIIPLAVWAYVTTTLILPSLVRGGEPPFDGPDLVVLAIGWGALPLFAILGLYALVSVYRARARFVTL